MAARKSAFSTGIMLLTRTINDRAGDLRGRLVAVYALLIVANLGYGRGRSTPSAITR